MTLTWWEIVIMPVLTLLLNFFAVPIHLYLERKRQRAVNGLRMVSEIFSKYQGKDSLWEAERTNALWDKIAEWKKYPNALGSEANLAILVGEFCAAQGVEDRERRILDRALNSLDQRASERERGHNKRMQPTSG